jgi:hypothetical protein
LFLRKISEEIGLEIGECRQIHASALSEYREMKHHPDNSNKFDILQQEADINLDFEFCFENFSNICRFCLRLRNDENEFREIYNSSEEQIDESNRLIEKIHSTIFDIVS